MKVLLKSVTIIDASSPFHNTVQHIFVDNGRITTISKDPITEKATMVFEGGYVSQGWTDSSVCLGEPGFEVRETIANGLQVAAKSGFTHVCVNPLTHPVVDNDMGVRYLKEKANGAVCTLHPIGALTKKSNGEDLAELYDMKNAGAVAFGDYKKSINNSNLLKIALQYTQNFGGLVISFANDPQVAGKGVVNEHISATKLGLKGIPALAEELCVARDLAILEYAGGKLHIPTISTAKSVEMIRQAKQKGIDVSCSVAIHNLHFTDEVLDQFDTNFKVMPPLRDAENVKALREALTDGTIDFVTSDHNPLDIELKFKEFDYAHYGTIGLETAFGILSQYVSVQKAVELLTAARKRFGIAQHPIVANAVADITLFTTESVYVFGKEHILSASHNSAFLSQKMKGKVIGCIANNKTTF